MLRIGVDIGGTFTDCVMVDEATGAVRLHKQLTTPDDPSDAVIEGVVALLGDSVDIVEISTLVHGTTLVTNALIERKGSRTGMLVTAGMRDILDIGRERRYDLFDLRLVYPRPVVPRRLRREIAERVSSDGAVTQPIGAEEHPSNRPHEQEGLVFFAGASVAYRSNEQGSTAMSRLPPVDDAVSEDLFSRIVQSRGWVSNLLRCLAHSPEGLAKLQDVGHFGRYETELTERERELAICITGRNVPYAWAHHAPLAEQTGIEPRQLEAIRGGAMPAGLSPAEKALCAYCFQFAAAKGVDDACFEELQAHYSNRQITDITILCAYYIAMGGIIIGLRVEIEPPEVLQIEIDWQRRKSAEQA